MSEQPATTSDVIRLADYAPPPFRITTIALRVELGEDSADVRSDLTVERHPDATDRSDELRLDGHDMALVGIALDGNPLGPERYRRDDEGLTVIGVPDNFRLSVHTRIEPQNNTALEGLYRSGEMFCTQCEAEGFRRITYYQDRPDILATYTTTIVADKRRYPILLSNGNPIDQGEDGHLHWVTWEDPYPKPSYLFALVAGNLACYQDSFRTASGRDVDLRIYVEPHNHDKCEHAMQSLIKSMRWDEEVYGLEYDLDIYMIVAVDHFNMGAMENKGLNVFNSKYVLASPATATDTDFANIEAIIAHEYFHNWTGNRVTCRDWFQLSLKEGLTVFRDQEFSADMGSRAVTRIGDVRILRSAQFKEDAGPMAHPVRPSEYIEINNFYTVTIYNKGAEVIRMIHRLLGAANFRKGMDLYFKRHDGAAVTTDDFVQAMEDASGIDLTQFRRWYVQAGTPVLSAHDQYDATTQRYTLTLTQSCEPTADGSPKEPFHFPVEVGLLDPTTGPLDVKRTGTSASATSHALELTEPSQDFIFEGVERRPIPSILRGFTAPVKLEVMRDDADLAHLVSNDQDPFNRWDAAQELALAQLDRLIDAAEAGAVTADAIDLTTLLSAQRALLTRADLDRAFVAEAIQLPSESYIGDRREVIDVDAIHAARAFLQTTMANELETALWDTYARCQSNEAYRFNAQAAASRSLKNTTLAYLMHGGDERARHQGLDQLRGFENMTDAFGALAAITVARASERDEALALFEQRWSGDPLVMDKWFSVQAVTAGPEALDEVRRLTEHRGFDMGNPNRVRALLGAFFHQNPTGFHRRDGAGYDYLAETLITLDRMNPQVAARLSGAFGQWRRYDSARQAQMQAAMERVLAAPGASKDVSEILSKTLSAT